MKNIKQLQAQTASHLKGRLSMLRRRKQSGFTLLELLVVVAILAAIAGTTAIALQDTDARASAAAHVAMMDELNKGLLTYEALNFGAFPDRFDSLLEVPDPGAATPGTTAVAIGTTGAGDDVVAVDAADRVVLPGGLSAGMLAALDSVGITTLRYIDVTATATTEASQDDPAYDCGDMQTTILSRSNALTAGTMFLSPEANGCGVSLPLEAASVIHTWTGGNERITGNPADTAADWDGVVANSANAKVFVMLGVGPSSSLFDRTGTGALTTVPIYRHVSNVEYNRFIAIFHLADVNAAADALTVADQVVLVGVVDGAGDTKEEELGEWDGSRNTI